MYRLSIVRHSPITVSLCLMTLTGCPKPPVAPPPDAVSTAPTPVTVVTAREDVSGARTPADAAPVAPTLPVGPAPDAVTRELTLGWSDEMLPTAAADSLLGRLGALSDPNTLPAAFFAAARRLPPTHLARLYELTPPASRDLVARGLCGRTVGAATSPTSVPPGWFASPPTLPMATVAGRFAINPAAPIDLRVMLTSADPDVVIAGARMIPVASVTLPPVALLSALSPYAVTAISRPLATRARSANAVTPREYWTTLLNLVAPRAHDAPRTWGNAWRALRDALPLREDPNLGITLVTIISSVMNPVGLPESVSVRWNCENAIAADKVQGMPSLTLRCAADTNSPYALAAQAEVLGSATTQSTLRAETLASLAERGRASPVVLSAVATAATELPLASVRALLRRLATERDPGVLASLLEGITKHPELAQAFTAPARMALLHAPFALPEGPSLEARVQAIKLARALHLDPNTVTDGRASEVRAIHIAINPGAEVVARAVSPGSDGPTRVRFDTDAGPFELELDPTHSPAGVAQLLNAVRAHRYDGLTMHRIVPGFVAQGGDPRGDGYGGTDSPTPTELSLAPFARGAIGIPLAGLDTGGIQFFVTLADVPHLDGRYPWAGTVRRGLEVIESLLPGDVLRHAEVVPR